MRHIGDRGSTRHILLIALVGAVLYAGWHWEGKVSCLFQNLSTGISQGISIGPLC